MTINLKSILLLFKIKLKILLNGFTKGESKKRFQKIFVFVGGSVLFVFIYLWIFELLTVLANNTALNVQLIDNAMMALFLMFFIFLLASGITISIHYLFISSDLPLLFSSPISENTIFTFKLIEAIFANSSFFFFVGMPTFIAYGIVTHASWFYYPLMIINALFFLTIPVSISFLGALLIVRIIPASRAREFMAILLAIVSLGIWLILQVVRASAFDRSSPDFNPENMEQLGNISNISFLNLLPSTWAARALKGFSELDFNLIIYNFLPLLIIVICLFYICLRLSKSAFEKGIIGSEQSITVKKRISARKQKTGALPVFGNFFSNAVGSILLRDFKLFTRDSRQFTNILMFAAVMIIFPLIQKSDQFDGEFSLYRPYLFILFFGAMSAVQLSSRLIPLEKKSFWISKLVPQSGLSVIWGKFLLSFSFNTILTWLAVIFISTYFGHPFRLQILALLATFVLSGIFSATGLLFGIYYAKFDWDHPKRMLTTTGGLLMSLSTFLGTGILGGIVALIFVIGNFLQLSTQFIDIAAATAIILMAFIIVNIVNIISARKFEKLEWLY
jgi:ABC-2 type transport system permease protein